MNETGLDKGLDNNNALHGRNGAPTGFVIDEVDEPELQKILDSLDDINLGFDFKVLDILDDEKSTPANIEAVKDQLGSVVSARLFSLANSVHYGKLRSGRITKFVDVVKHLGTATTKSTAIFIALLTLAETEEIKIIFARNYATSKLAEIISAQLDLRRDDSSTVTLAGLFVEMGKVIILLFANKSGQLFNKEFLEKYNAYIGAKVIEVFELPESLKEIIIQPYLKFIRKESLSLTAIVRMAHAVVDDSFRKHGKFVIQSPMPDIEGVVYNSTIGSILAEQFQSMGLASYFKIIISEYTDQEQRLLDKHQKNL